MLKRIFPILVIFITIVSCSTDKMPEDNEQESFTSAEFKSIFESENVAGVADDFLTEIFTNNILAGKTGLQNECFETQVSLQGFSITFNNCELDNMQNVNGTLNVVYSPSLENIAFAITYEDFTVGEYAIEGTRTVTSTNDGDSDLYVISTNSDLTITDENGDEISEIGTKVLSYVLDADMTSTSYELTGDWAIEADGNTYAIEVTEPLIGDMSCNFFTAGKMTINRAGTRFLVDLGDGTCDDKATVTLPDGTTTEITIES